ncbi:restriction endonuclease subunit S [Candidatus Thiosymbion oneisti]|uniref:restriction endonuclease subunit S n=1 Tax=Candidatus Thiosymbion oneisti TaxID=589554 RepID=UPI00105F6B83|nr:restriction endonuclease subunit S [Candidatus Thiosymbion oneisti]
MAVWSTVSIGDILTKSESWIPIAPDTEYKEVTVRLWGRGVSLRGIKLGSEISSLRRLQVTPGQFIVSRIDARHGAFGVIPKELDGAVVTNDFPVFTPNLDRLSADFLGWLSKTQRFVDVCKKASEGTTNRVRLKENRFAEIEIELPSLDEQRRIVAKIESLAAKIDQARQLRQAIRTDMDSLLVAMAHRNDLTDDEKLAQGWKRVALGEVLTQVFDPVEVEPGKEYPHFGIYSFAKGLFKKAPLSGDEIKASKLYRVREGQFIYGRLNAYEGAFAIIGKDYDQHHVSNEFPAFACVTDRILPEFMLAYFSTPVVWEAIKRKVTGIGGGAGNRRIRLKEDVLLSDEIWLPPIRWQQKIKTTTEQLAIAKQDRESAGLQLDALLPAILDRAFKGEL